MSKEAIMQVRTDSALKHDAEELFKKMGTSFTETMRIFATRSVEFGTIPFPIKAKTNNKRGIGIAKIIKKCNIPIIKNILLFFKFNH